VFIFRYLKYTYLPKSKEEEHRQDVFYFLFYRAAGLIRLTVNWQRESKFSRDRSSFISYFMEQLVHLGSQLTGRENRRGAETDRLSLPF
jgi:hypothetical protein